MKLTYLAAALLASTAVPAMAVPITYTFTGTFSGTLAGQGFTDVAAVFTGTGDTDTTNQGFGFAGILGVPLTSLSAVANGVTYSVTSPSFFYLYDSSFGLSPNTRLGLGFAAGGTNAIGYESPLFNGYDGLTSFATTTTPIYFANASFTTDQGAVSITSASLVGTFGASAVPEPASWAMMIGGVGLMGGALRRRRAAKVSTTVRFA